MAPFPWSLHEIEGLVAAGKLPAERMVQAAAGLIDSLDADIRAWCCLCLSRAETHAGELQAEAASQGPRSSLHGVPFGAKDIFDTKGIPTEWGSETQRGRTPAQDCAFFARLESLGCVLMGKTHTTAFAYYDTGPTRNPRDLARTPGGSSSGSAAAVAAGMVPLAIGSQTQGSVLRPASFCGIAGFKPSHGALPLDGVMPFAPTLDHAGIFTRTAADVQVVWRALGFDTDAAPAPAITVLDWPPQGRLEPSMASAFRSSIQALIEAGMGVDWSPRPAFFDSVPAALHAVMAFEAAREHGIRYREHGQRIGEKLAALLDEGLAIEESKYRAACRTLLRARDRFAEWSARHPVTATPAALGPPPMGLGSSGDPRCNAPFRALGAPAVSIPMPSGTLPLGLQLAAPHGCDARLLSTAAKCERLLSSPP